jgi:hypothetical protein
MVVLVCSVAMIEAMIALTCVLHDSHRKQAVNASSASEVVVAVADAGEFRYKVH